MNTPEYRVTATHYKWRNNMGEPEEKRIQYLQEKKIFKLFWLYPIVYWVNVDSEIVPSFAWIHKGVFGDESSWKSKFKDVPNCNFYK